MKRITRTTVFIFQLCLLQLSAYCQPGDDVIKNIASKLKTFSGDHICEKTYLHFDKPYYASGDTIYFKAYVTTGESHEPSKLSGVLYVDLINTHNKIDQSIKLQILDGVAWGDFALPDSLPKGNYNVRAYTKWMRNSGDDSYFYKTIAIGSSLNNKIPESGVPHIAATNSKPDLQFFPEGGELITGISSKIAFKAIGTNGFGIDAKGIVVDDKGNEVVKFTTARLGMGYFYLKPEIGRSYRVKTTYANGIQDIMDLPTAKSNGIVLKIDNDSLDKAPLQIMANESYFAENNGKAINLLVYSGGIFTMVPLSLDSATMHLAILKGRLHTGIVRVTLFSGEGEPLSERLFFVQNSDQLRLTINTDKVIYSRREKVHFGLNAVNRMDSAVAGHFSVSVIDENKVQVDEDSENTIFNYLLLTSDLKGHIEQPNYYFANITDKTRSDLDLVMLTHGHRRFEWKKLLNNDYPAVAYQPENSLEITGTAKNLFNKPVKNGTVSLIAMHSGKFISERTDDMGRFRFSNLMFNDTDKFILQAVNSKGKNTTTLFYDKDMTEPSVPLSMVAQADTVDQLMTAYMENSKKQQNEIDKYGNVKGKMLKTVTITGKKKDQFNFDSIYPDPEFADQNIYPNQMPQGSTFAIRISGLIHGMHIVWEGSGAYAVLNVPFGSGPGHVPVILDGVKTDGDLNEITGLNVASVEVLESLGTGGPALIITTKAGVQPEDIVSKGVLPISPKGFYKAREFYSPKYDQINLTNNRSDLRSTIYWKPELVTDKDGNASFEYYNADGTGNYKIIIEGIDDKGNLGRQVFKYKVE